MEGRTSALRIAAVGLGQAGGNLASEFHRRGHPALALNTAHSDLATLDTRSEGLPLPEEKRLYIGIDGHDGAGGDAEYGRSCLESHAARILEAVEEVAEDAEAIVLVAGLGGGTGSNLATLARLLGDWPRLALAALPARHEGPSVQLAALRAVNEIVAVDDLGCILADNAALIRTHASVSIHRFYETINRAIVEPLDALLRINESDELAALRPLDGEDLRGLLLSGGLLHYAEAPLESLSAEGLVQVYLESLQDGPIMSAGYDPGHVARAALAVEGGPTELATTPFSFAEEVHRRVAEATHGAQVTLSLYRASGESKGVTLRVLSASTELPNALRETAGEVQQAVLALHEKLHGRPSPLDLGEVALVTSASPRRRVLDGDRLLVRAGEPQAEPAPGEDGDALAIEGSDSEAAGLERRSFDRIADAFRKAKSQKLKDEIADRLRAFGTSGKPLVRYYAVNAMAQLDTDAFRDALRRAAADEDPHVRRRASEALEPGARRGRRADRGNGPGTRPRPSPST